jgi:hypothetical protein
LKGDTAQRCETLILTVLPQPLHFRPELHDNLMQILDSGQLVLHGHQHFTRHAAFAIPIGLHISRAYSATRPLWLGEQQADRGIIRPGAAGF